MKSTSSLNKKQYVLVLQGFQDPMEQEDAEDDDVSESQPLIAFYLKASKLQERMEEEEEDDKEWDWK